MDKQTFLETLRSARAAWDAQMEATLDHPSAGLKDLIAHVAWYEREMTAVVEGRALAGSDLWALPTDARNAAIQAELQAANATRTLAEVCAEAGVDYARLVAALEDLPATAFGDAAHFAGMPPDWAPLEMLAENTILHYAQHRDDLA